MLNKELCERYSRHIPLKSMGEEGQLKLSQSKVLIVGAGGLGSPAALYLAASGVGTIGIADGDTIALSNLQRQIIHTTQEIGKSKVESAKSKILSLNPNLKVLTYNEYLKKDALQSIIISENYDFIIDATDNFDSKFTINDVCVKLNKSYSHGGITEYQGETMTYLSDHSCYRCFIDGDIDKNVSSSVFAPVAGIIGSIQASETIKYLLGIDSLLTDCMLIYDAYFNDFRKIPVSKNADCICNNKLKQYL